MRCDLISMHLAQKIGKVLYVERSISYLSKTSGQRVRILVSSLEDLFERIFHDIEDMEIDDNVLWNIQASLISAIDARKWVMAQSFVPKM